LERLIAEGMTLTERRNAIEFFRDQAAEQFERHTGSPWPPRSGSLVNHRTLTLAMIDPDAGQSAFNLCVRTEIAVTRRKTFI
jgi:hypothetical protein